MSVEKDVVTFGRAIDNDLSVQDHAVSRHHAQLRRRGEEWVIVDLGSRNGTLLNGRRLHGEQVVLPGSDITIGRETFLFESADAPTEATLVTGDLRAGNSGATIDQAPRLPTPSPDAPAPSRS
jgi:pSer/pThr/pTyr-binding forkhead associated (FHA) protein